MFKVLETKEYIKWFQALNKKEQTQIQARIALIQNDGHFGVVKKINSSLAELKWKNGRRVYFTLATDKNGELLILLLGGNKNTQAKDILKACRIIKKLSINGEEHE